MKKILLIIFLLSLSLNSSAAYVWTEPVKVLEPYFWYKSDRDRRQVKADRQIVSSDPSISLKYCDVTDNENTVGRWDDYSNKSRTLFSALLNAFNLGLSVQLQLESGNCSKYSGLKLIGVKILND